MINSGDNKLATAQRVGLAGQHGKQQARRWVAERTHAWANCLRKLRIRWEKKTENWEDLWHFANILTVYRMTILG